VPTQRSAKVFALGACGGVRITSTPAAANTASKATVNFVSRSRSRNRSPWCPVAEVHEQVPRLLGRPGTGRMCGDTDDVYLASREFDEEQHVDPFEEHGVDREDVAGQDRVRLGGQELSPGRARPAWCRVHAGAVQDLPDSAGRNPVAQTNEFAPHAPMPPGRIRSGQAQHQLTDLPVNGWPAARCMWVGPVPGEQLPVRNSVAGMTKNADQRARGSSRDNAASTTRSQACTSGRCSTATS
jgi:hypothetical protein